MRSVCVTVTDTDTDTVDYVFISPQDVERFTALAPSLCPRS